LTVLEENRRLYEILVSDIIHSKQKFTHEELARKISWVANFAHQYFTGLLSDFRLEDILNEIGRKIEIENINGNKKHIERKASKSSKRKVLHIATSIYSVGGHSRVIMNWAKMDTESEHSIILTEQTISIDETFKKDFVELFNFYFEQKKDDSILNKAIELRQIVIEEKFDLVILHTHFNDVIPVIAFSHDEIPPIALFNHANHTFWLGISISDFVIDFAEESEFYSKKYRGVKNTFLLPIPIGEQPKLKTKRESLKKKKVLASMATEGKYKPYKDLDFLKFYSEFLLKNKDVVLYIIGLTEEKYQEYYNGKKPSNLVLCGYVTNPTEILVKADYFIESFPMGSILACLDAVRNGAHPIFNYKGITIFGKESPIVFPNEIAEQKVMDINSYSELVDNELKTGCIKNKSKQSIKKFIEELELPKWKVHLQQFYDTVINKKHEISMLRVNKYIDTEEANNWAEFQNNKEKFIHVINFSSKIDIRNLLFLASGYYNAADYLFRKKSLKTGLKLILKAFK